jgi:hypothetical protein
MFHLIPPLRHLPPKYQWAVIAVKDPYIVELPSSLNNQSSRRYRQ